MATDRARHSEQRLEDSAPSTPPTRPGQQVAAEARADHGAQVGRHLAPARDGALALAGRLSEQPLVDQRVRHRADEPLQEVEHDRELDAVRERQTPHRRAKQEE